MNNNQPPFSFMPMPFNPWMFPQNQPPSQPVTTGPPPARVRVALEFLMDLTIKGMTRGIANDISIELIPGRQLTPDESEAQKAACQCLKDYFKGKTKPDVYERIAQKKIERKTLANGKPGMVLRCVACGGNTLNTANCVVCRGTGEIMVFPTIKDEKEDED